MRISLNTSNPRWFDRVWAALIFFTRLPFWRIYQPPQCAYETVVEHWPLMGWLTGGVMALTFLVSSFWVSASVSVVLAMVARLLLTGALHEDGLADFFVFFGGGGNDRERILAIMKDSRIGTFGVLGLIIYELLFFLLLRDFAVSHYYLVTALFIGDKYLRTGYYPDGYLSLSFCICKLGMDHVYTWCCDVLSVFDDESQTGRLYG